MVSKPIAVACAWLSLATLARTVASAAAEPVTLQSIIEKVRANEALFANLELRLRSAYTSGEQPPDGAAEVSFNFKSISKKEASLHFISQRDKFRFELTGRASFPGGKSDSLARIRAFDGETTRLMDQERIGNIFEGRVEDENVIRPHMFLLRIVRVTGPLSDYLNSDSAPGAAPEDRWISGRSWHVVYHGHVSHESHVCHRVSVTSLRNGKPINRVDILLDADRNLIPVHVSSFRMSASDSVPTGEHTITEWQELSPSVWFPRHAVATAYDQITFEQKRTKVIAWQEKQEVTEVSLSPAYDDSYFSDVKFPEGIPVHHVPRQQQGDESNTPPRIAEGKGIALQSTDGSVLQTPKFASPPPPGDERTFRRWIMFNVALVTALAIGCFAGWRLSRRA